MLHRQQKHSPFRVSPQNTLHTSNLTLAGILAWSGRCSWPLQRYPCVVGDTLAACDPFLHQHTDSRLEHWAPCTHARGCPLRTTRGRVGERCTIATAFEGGLRGVERNPRTRSARAGRGQRAREAEEAAGSLAVAAHAPDVQVACPLHCGFWRLFTVTTLPLLLKLSD